MKCLTLLKERKLDGRYAENRLYGPHDIVHFVQVSNNKYDMIWLRIIF